MSILPVVDEFVGNPVVDVAVRALAAFGDLSRSQAAELLTGWKYAPELTRRERAAVLRRFPERVS